MGSRFPIRLGAALIAICLLGPSATQAQFFRPPPAKATALVAADGVQPGTGIRAALHVRLPEGLHVNSNNPRDPSLIPIVLSIDPPSGISVTEVVYPQATNLIQQGADQPLAVYEREFAIGVRLDIANDVPAGDIVVPGSLRYQACDERVCYFPATAVTSWTLRIVPPAGTVNALHPEVFDTIAFGNGSAPETNVNSNRARAEPIGGDDPIALLNQFTMLGSTGGYLGREDFLGFIRAAETGAAEKGWFEDRGLIAILFIVLVGGLALNLTPCVLPMIPINLAIIGAGVEAGSRRRGFLLGSAYGAAMALAYGILGIIVILTAGTFGTINASPWFNFAIATVFVVLGLAVFDMLTIDFSRFLTRLNVQGQGRGTFLVAFGMGTVAALLAGACVAPVVIQVVLFSSNLYTTGTTAALALPFLLGIGMAAPWPLAGAGLSALPKPGAWMVRVKHAFGVAILGTAIYYGYLGYALLADRWVEASEVTASVEKKLKEGWYASLAEGLAAAQREQKPVLVDLWATWCKNCLTMDRTTLVDPAVTDTLEGYVKVKFQAENPDEDHVQAVMQRFGAIGLPTYVILKPGI
jgi:thioredoxin:protein disulfide reductase